MKKVIFTVVGINSGGNRQIALSELFFHDSVKQESIDDVARGQLLMMQEEANRDGLKDLESKTRTENF
jgi:hypothetical protein